MTVPRPIAGPSSPLPTGCYGTPGCFPPLGSPAQPPPSLNSPTGAWGLPYGAYGNPGSPPPSRMRDFFYSFVDPNITPAQTRTLFRWNAVGNLGMNIFTGGFGLNLDTLASVAGVMSLIPGFQALMVPVAGYYLGKAAFGIAKALIFDTLFGDGFDLGNIIQSVAFGALSAMMVLPFGKIGQIRQLFSNFGVGEAFRRTVTLCYGREVTSSGLRAMQAVRNLGQRGTQAGGQQLGCMERLGQFWQNLVNGFNRGRQGVRVPTSPASGPAASVAPAPIPPVAPPAPPPQIAPPQVSAADAAIAELQQATRQLRAQQSLRQQMQLARQQNMSVVQNGRRVLPDGSPADRNGIRILR